MLWKGGGALKSDAALRVLRHITGIKQNGSIRHEFLDRTFFWTTIDLENKSLEFLDYFNGHCTHASLDGRTPDPQNAGPLANLHSYRWQAHCRGF
jgi:hypothetical protein